MIAQPGEELGDGVAAVGDGGFFFLGHFGEGAGGGGIEEVRIVAEAMFTAGGVEDGAFDGAAEGSEDTILVDEGDDADVASGAERLAGDFAHQAGVVVGVVAGPAGGVDTGSAAEGVDLEAAVFGDEPAVGVASVVKGFFDGVGLEGGPGFGGDGEGGESGEHLDVEAGAGEFADFTGVGGGQIELHFGVG